MNEGLKELVDATLATRTFNGESLSGHKSKNIVVCICDCDPGDDDGGCSD